MFETWPAQTCRRELEADTFRVFRRRREFSASIKRTLDLVYSPAWPHWVGGLWALAMAGRKHRHTFGEAKMLQTKSMCDLASRSGFKVRISRDATGKAVRSLNLDRELASSPYSHTSDLSIVLPHGVAFLGYLEMNCFLSTYRRCGSGMWTFWPPHAAITWSPPLTQPCHFHRL